MPASVLAGILSAAGAIVIGAGREPPREPAPQAVPNPAPRLIFWVGCERDVVRLRNAELAEWKSRGVDGFVCMVNHLRGLGGTQDFTGDPKARLRGRNYRLQRALRNSRIVRRADAHGLKMYLGAYLGNYFNTATPLAEWFDRSWSERVLPRLTDLAGAARLLGFAGVAFDGEMYPQTGGVTSATWAWDYPGNVHTEAKVRAQARHRGAQVMQAILRSFPRAQLAVYAAVFPGDWSELVQQEVNANPNTSTDRLDVDFWDGITSVEGYKAIRFYDATFYKSPHLGTWDNAFTYLQNRTYATFSQRFSNWRYAWPRVHVAPFAWIDEGPDASTEFDDAPPADRLAEQLLAFRKWTAGGEFANFAYAGLDDFDYSDYAGAMREASTAATGPRERPKLELAEVSKDGGRVTIEGSARDDLAIRAVHWRDERGRKGVAVVDWEIFSGDHSSGYSGQTRWSISVPLRKHAAEMTIKAVDIEGQSSRGAVVRRRQLTTGRSA